MGGHYLHPIVDALASTANFTHSDYLESCQLVRTQGVGMLEPSPLSDRRRILILKTMKLDEVDLDTNPVEHVPSPRRCIYCHETQGLTHEHVIPFGLGAHSLILDKANCQACQRTIQPYEQAVLKHQLGNFRAQVCAPTRRPKDRPTEIRIPAIEVDDAGRFLRDLGTWTVPIDDAPLLLSLWSSPPPRLLLPAGTEPGIGRAWSFAEASRVKPLVRRITSATGARHVALKAGEVNRLHYLRFLPRPAMPSPLPASGSVRLILSCPTSSSIDPTIYRSTSATIRRWRQSKHIEPRPRILHWAK